MTAEFKTKRYMASYLLQHLLLNKMNQRLTGAKTNQLKKGNAVRSDAYSHLPDGTFLRIWPIKVAE